MKVLAKNKRATYDYAIEDKLMAGLVLSGAEVKSIKAGHASLKGSFIHVRDGEAWLTNAHVTPYANAHEAQEATRARKLLLHRKQIDEIIKGGHTPVPMALLEQKNLVKLEVGLGRGKKRYDKREVIKKRDTERDLQRKLKS
ncbi:MAG TPA: SsrA-binding protein SmpB [Candidatus Nanoarchaeia archaeon]|nr:SsrA-binding protein SmpB [Candidatus Nanoarchaeia archaeon]